METQIDEAMMFLALLSEDREIISYRPRLARITGSILASIFLQQVIFRWKHMERQPFYKFRSPCPHEKYRSGDSWEEELAFSVSEIGTARDKVATKIMKGQSKDDVLGTTEADFDEHGRMRNAQALIIYWTDKKRVTWYQLNEALFVDAMKKIYSSTFTAAPSKPAAQPSAPPASTPQSAPESDAPKSTTTPYLSKSRKSIYLSTSEKSPYQVNRDSRHILPTETTTETTTTPAGAGAADAAGGGGRKKKPPREQRPTEPPTVSEVWLQSIGMGRAKRHALRDIPLDVLQKKWQTIDPARVQDAVSVLGDFFTDWQPPAADAPKAGAQRIPAPYLQPDWATLSQTEQRQQMDDYERAVKRQQMGGAR